VIFLLGLVFTAGCVAASAWRLFCVIELTPVDHASLAAALRSGRQRLPADPLHALEVIFAATPRADWECDAVRAFGRRVEASQALVGEVMTELDARAQRWVRVPRVCASLSSSFGFLLATVALRAGLSRLMGPLLESSVASVNAGVFEALDVVAVGLVGAAFCMAIQYQARAAVRARVAASERLVEVMETLRAREGSTLAGPGPRASVDLLHVKDEVPSPIVEVTAVASKGSL
jgi:hypothetical protein